MGANTNKVGKINKFLFELIQKNQKNNKFKKNILKFYDETFYNCFLQNSYNHIIPKIKAHHSLDSSVIGKAFNSFSTHTLSVIYNDGRVTIKLSGLTFKLYLKFVYKWIIMLFYILKPIATKNKIHISKGIIILGFPIGQLMSVESDQPLTDFFKKTKVKPLNSRVPKFIQCPENISVDENLFEEARINIKTAKQYFQKSKSSLLGASRTRIYL